MIRSIPTSLIGSAAALMLMSLHVCAVAEDDGFKPLFDGKTLDGWHGNADLWSVKEEAIVGECDGNIPDNTFLISDGEYGNFVLKIKFLLHNHTGNSGVQFRSRELKGADQQVPFVVAGNQADIASERYMGILYGEKTRGIVADVTSETTAAIEKAVNKDGWNEYVITADGDHIKMELNGVTTVDIEDKDGEKSGVIALQLHRGHNMRISFKDIEIKVLE